MTTDNLRELTNEEFRKLFHSMMEEREKRVHELEITLKNTLNTLNGLGVEVCNRYGDSFESDTITLENDF